MFLPTGVGFEADNTPMSSYHGLSNTGGVVDLSCQQQVAATPGAGFALVSPPTSWYAWEPDLRKDQALLGAGIMIKF